jgi:hypothetical protein
MMHLRKVVNVSIVVAFALVTGCASKPYASALKLDGSEEVPPVKTSAKAKGEIVVKPDRSVGGQISVSDFTPTVAHIHSGAPGKNGPVIITLKKTEDGSFVVPDGAKLNEAQYSAYQAGNLYVNVHSATNPSGEVRNQIKPVTK